MRSDRERGQSAIAHDLDAVDALFVLRDRFDGLRCAIRGASFASDADRRGLLQLAEDIGEALDDVCATRTHARDKASLVPRKRGDAAENDTRGSG